VAGWLHTEINGRHRELNPDTVADLSTDRARRRLTSLIEANALTTPDHQLVAGVNASSLVRFGPMLSDAVISHTATWRIQELRLYWSLAIQ